MCGIAGFCLTPASCSTAEEVTELAAQMLYDIEHRGIDATGASWINTATNKRAILKHAMAATKFVPTVGKYLCENAQTAILHTRYATKGSPNNRDNNHPIARGNIVLTHNGHILNDDEVFKRLGVQRNGAVDSEAAAALIAFTASKYHPTEVLGALRGGAALAWIDSNDATTLHLARVNSSPLWIGQTFKGNFLYGSTLEVLSNGAIMLDDSLEWEWQTDERSYFKVRDGRVIEHEQISKSASAIYSVASWQDKKIDADWKARIHRKKVKQDSLPF